MWLPKQLVWVFPLLHDAYAFKESFRPLDGGLRASPVPAEVDYASLDVDTSSPFWNTPDSIGLLLSNLKILARVSANIASTKLDMTYTNTFSETVHPYMHLPIHPNAALYKLSAGYTSKETPFEVKIKSFDDAMKDFHMAQNKRTNAVYGNATFEDPSTLQIKLADLKKDETVKLTIEYVQELPVLHSGGEFSETTVKYSLPLAWMASYRHTNEETTPDEKIYKKAFETFVKAKSTQTDPSFNFTLILSEEYADMNADLKTVLDKSPMAKKYCECPLQTPRYRKPKMTAKKQRKGLVIKNKDNWLTVPDLTQMDFKLKAAFDQGLLINPKKTDNVNFTLYSRFIPQNKATPSKSVEYIIAIDKSGQSMDWYKRQESAIQAVNTVVNFMGQDDYFNVIAFGEQADSAFNQSVKGADDTKEEAGAFIRRLSSTGASSIKVAVLKALEVRAQPVTGTIHNELQFMVISGGDDSDKKGTLESLKKSRNEEDERTMRTFTAGVGATGEVLLKEIAKAGGGYAAKYANDRKEFTKWNHEISPNLDDVLKVWVSAAGNKGYTREVYDSSSAESLGRRYTHWVPQIILKGRFLNIGYNSKLNKIDAIKAIKDTTLPSYSDKPILGFKSQLHKNAISAMVLKRHMQFLHREYADLEAVQHDIPADKNDILQKLKAHITKSSVTANVLSPFTAFVGEGAGCGTGTCVSLKEEEKSPASIAVCRVGPLLKGNKFRDGAQRTGFYFEPKFIESSILYKQQFNGAWFRTFLVDDVNYNVEYMKQVNGSSVLKRLDAFVKGNCKCDYSVNKFNNHFAWTVAALVALEEFYGDIEHLWESYKHKAWNKLEKRLSCKRMSTWNTGAKITDPVPKDKRSTTGATENEPAHEEAESCKIKVDKVLKAMGTHIDYNALL